MFLVPLLEEVSWGERQERSEGSEFRTINNLEGAAEVTRKFVLTRQWSETFTVKNQEQVVKKLNADLGKTELLKMGASVEQKLLAEVAVSNSKTKTLSEEVTVTVPSGKATRMEIRWKSLWRTGTARFSLDLVESYRNLFDGFSALLLPLGSVAMAQLASFLTRSLIEPRVKDLFVEFEQADGYTFDLVFVSETDLSRAVLD